MEEDEIPLTTELPSLPSPQPRRRPICRSCNRPATVCLCPFIPSPPITTTTQIVILQHPHERRHRLATVPVLSACLSAVNTVVGRRLSIGLSPLLDSIAARTFQSRAVYLFPSTVSCPAVPLSRLQSSGYLHPHTVLIVFDATWNHAAEMVAASCHFLSSISAIRVSLDSTSECCRGGGSGGSIYDSELILRKEPQKGYVSTMEAVAKVMGILEPEGVEIEHRLIQVLKAMVRFQASNLEKKELKKKPMKSGNPN